MVNFNEAQYFNMVQIESRLDDRCSKLVQQYVEDI